MTQSDSNFIGVLVAAALVLATVTLMSVAFTTARAAAIRTCGDGAQTLDCSGARALWDVKRHAVVATAYIHTESAGKAPPSALSY